MAKKTTKFDCFASKIESIYGSQYDREEGFVCCPECGEPIYDCDWSFKEYTIFLEDGRYQFVCPICGTEL